MGFVEYGMKHKNQSVETAKREPEYTLKDVGCYVDGVRGIYAIDRIVDIAESHGFDLNDDDPQNPLPESLSGYEFANEIEDDVDSFMNANYGVEGAYWGRNENGDWGLWELDDYEQHKFN